MGKIIVAEDSIIVNQHIRLTLETANHEVISVYSGKEAIESAKTNAPNLILMDIMMENSTDGLDAALEIKQTLDIPIIFLTALTDEPTIEKAKFSLPYGYVTKPFNESELLSNIDVALYKAKAERRIKENSELFQMIINSINQCIILLDQNNFIKYTNGSFERLLDKKFDVLVDRPLNDLIKIYEEGNEITYDRLNLETEVRINDLPYIFSDFRIQEVKMDDVFQLLVFNDITDRVKMREAKEHLKNKQVKFLIEGQEKERERISRDLHDGVGQIANLIKLEAKKNEGKSELISLVNLFLDEMRKATEDLLPSRLKDFPLEIAINKLIDQANESSDIAFTFNYDDIPDLEMSKKVNLYRIVQECISNILKHSKASNASVQFFGFNDHLQISFEDDGQGFILEEKRDASHHGLQNIMFRTEVMNATWDLDSQKGTGTFINIKIPYDEKD